MRLVALPTTLRGAPLPLGTAAEGLAEGAAAGAAGVADHGGA